MSAPKNRGILKDKSFQSLGTSKTTSFNEISLMHTTQRAVRPETCTDRGPLPAHSSFNVSAASLAEELKKVSESNQFNFGFDSEDDSSEDEYLASETIQERVQRLEFERRRSLHYTEFRTVQLARRLIAEEFSTSSETIESEHVIESDFKTSSCDAEECPSVESHDSVGNKSLEQMIAEKLFLETQLAEQEPEPEVELEPRFSPSHPCYQKLTGKGSALPDRSSKSNVDPI